MFSVYYAMKFISKVWLFTIFCSGSFSSLLVLASFSRGLSDFAYPGSESIKVESWINPLFIFKIKALSWLFNYPHISSSLHLLVIIFMIEHVVVLLDMYSEKSRILLKEIWSMHCISSQSQKDSISAVKQAF